MQKMMRTRRDFRVLSSGVVVQVPPPQFAAALIFAMKWAGVVLVAALVLWGSARVSIVAIEWLTEPSIAAARSYHLQLAEAARAGGRG